MRRLLAGGRLYGIKIGPVWGVYPQDIETFKRGRRPPGRPRKAAVRRVGEEDTRNRITRVRASAGTDDALLKPKQERTPRRAG